jgi:hypothetical protein
MKPRAFIRSAAKWLAGGVVLAGASYAAYVANAWFRYGKPRRPVGKELDALLDRFMPDYEIRDFHRIYVAAPAGVTFSTATSLDLEKSLLIRAIFKGRESILRSKPDEAVRPRGLLALTKSLGWGCAGRKSWARDRHGMRDKAVGAEPGLPLITAG